MVNLLQTKCDFLEAVKSHVTTYDLQDQLKKIMMGVYLLS